MPTVFLYTNTAETADTGALKIPKPEVIVEFRPATDYDSTYGFDWVRRGDTSILGDTDYKDIIGSCVAGVWLEDVDEVKLKQLYTDYPDSSNGVLKICEEEYPVPVLAIRKDRKVKLSLKVEVKRKPEKITFKYNEEVLVLSKKELDDTSVGEQDLTDHVEISFKEGKESKSTEFVEVFADEELAGQFRVLPNDDKNIYQAEVVFVYIRTDIGNGVPKTGKQQEGELDIFNRTFNQFLAKPKVTEVTWDLRTNDTLNDTLVLDDDGTNIIKKGDELFVFLGSEFSEDHSEYDDKYKVFFFEERGGRMKADGTIKGLGGSMKIGTKVGFVFSTTSRKTTTLPHEFMHGLGLRHTFDCNAKRIFEKRETSNIMDYTQERRNTWYWQWKKLWPKLKRISEV